MPIAMTTSASNRRMIVSGIRALHTSAHVPAGQPPGAQRDPGRPVQGNAAVLVRGQDRKRHHPGQ